MKAILIAFLFAASGVFGENFFNISPMPLSPEFVEELRAKGELDSVISIWRSFNQNNYLSSKSLPAEPLKSGGAVAILVDFSDNKADTSNHPPAKYDTLLFSVGKMKTGSMKDFYIENSYNLFNVTGKVAPPVAKSKKWYRLSGSYDYWSENYGFSHSGELALAAVQAADADIDFSQFDNDGPDGKPNSGDDDGIVDAVFVIHAGPGYEDNHCGKIWSHASGTSYETNDNAKGGGKIRIERYSIQPEERCNGELIDMGVFAHEYGHILGLPDLYDYDYDASGAGRWTLMASGSWNAGGVSPAHFDAWCKSQLGWVQPTIVTDYKIRAKLPAVEYTPTVYRLWTDGDTTPMQYFLIENRQKTGLFDSYLPGEGLLIYHVDDLRWSNNDQYIPEENPSYLHYHVAVEQADGKFDLEHYTNNGDNNDPFPGMLNRYEFAGFLPYPTTRDYSEEDTKVAVLSISASDSIMYADLDAGRHLPYLRLISVKQQSSGKQRIEPGGSGYIFVTLENKWGTGNNVELELAIDNSYVILTKSKVTLGKVPENDTVSNISNPFELTIAENAPGYLKIDAELVIRETTTGYEQRFTFPLTFGWPGVLIVNDSEDDNLSQIYEKNLEALGIPYEALTSNDLLLLDDVLLSEENRDSILIWFTGKKTATLTQEEQVLIEEFTQHAGKLILSSENLGEDLGNSPFYSNVMHAHFENATETENIFTGTSDNPLFKSNEKVSVLVAYSLSKDGISALDGAQEILSYPTDGNAAALTVNNDTTQIVYLAFPLEGVGGNPTMVLTQEELFRRFFDWFGYQIGIREDFQPAPLKTTMTLLTPFIAKDNIALMDISLTSRDRVKLNIYDARGSRISTHSLGLLDNGIHRIEIPVSGIPAGVYFVTLETSKGINTTRMVVLK